MISLHQPVNTFDAVIDVAVRSRLQSITPNFNFIVSISQSNLPTNRRRRFLAASVISAERAKDVMEPNNARIQPEVFGVVTTDALHVKLFPPITIFSVGR